MVVNYKFGKIYKLCSDETDKIYIGSTAQKYLSQIFGEKISGRQIHKSRLAAATVGPGYLMPTSKRMFLSQLNLYRNC